MTCRIANGFLICVLLLIPLSARTVASTESTFTQLVGQTPWRVNLKGFTISKRHQGNLFSLGVGNGPHLSFRAHPVALESQRFGPLDEMYGDHLVDLFGHALAFAGKSRAQEFTLAVKWSLYPENIRSWALVWKDSELRKNFSSMDRHERYTQLTEMITDHVKHWMAPIVQVLGLRVTGVHMEKMGFPTRKQLSLPDARLESDGIPMDLKIPIPLMLSVALQPAATDGKQAGTTIAPAHSISVGYLFVTAQKATATVFCTYQRALDEYEITGDRKNPDGSYARLMPLSQTDYHPIAAKLLQACLKATRGDRQASFSLRINLERYPDMFQDAVKHFTFMPNPSDRVRVKRTGIIQRPFFRYNPTSVSLFPTALAHFWKQLGYTFDSFEMSLKPNRKASRYKDYQTRFKPMGIKPGGRPSVPDIVYMILKKHKGAGDI